jgi:hypothetical protein
MRLTFTLQSAYAGVTYVAGPFNISGTTSGGPTYSLATGVTKAQLTAGHAVDTTYETITGGTITSTGTCGTSKVWYVGTPSSIYYVTNSGDYPRSNEGTTSITVTNNTGSPIYLYIRATSQSTNSGAFNGTLTNSSSQQISLTETITGYAQIGFSTTPLTLSLTSETFTLVRVTGSVSGPKYQIYYSLTNGGTKYDLPLPV